MKAMQVQSDWNVRDLTREKGAYNGTRWWAHGALKALGAFGESSVVVFPEASGADAAERMESLKAAANWTAATFSEFGTKGCRVGRGLEVSPAYRGVGSLSPVLSAEGVAPEKWVDFAKAVCAAAKEPQALVHAAGSGELWWMERAEESAKAPRGKSAKERVEEDAETAAMRKYMDKESRRFEEWVRHAGTVVVARVRVEDWFAPEGVFRCAWIKARKEHGAAGMEFALRWERKGTDKAGTFVERTLVVTGASLPVVEELVASVPGAVCREVQVPAEGKGDGRWLEEVFGEGPAGASGGEWVLAEAGYVEPPRPSVFGRHDRYFPIRERGETGAQEEKGRAEVRVDAATPVVPMASKIRAVSLLQWMGPKTWANKAEEKRVPDGLERVLRDGHFPWFRVATGEGIPISRYWMVFNAPGAWEHWRQYGVTRILDVCPEGCRGYWSGDGKQWWRVEACAPAGKPVRVENAKAAYRAACGRCRGRCRFSTGAKRTGNGWRRCMPG